MRRPGPLQTLIAGLIFALALALFGRTETSPEEAEEYGQAAKTANTANTGATAPLQQAAPARQLAAAAAKPATAAKPQLRATYAARATGSRAVVAITVRGDDAIAYVCDGHRLESWLRGKVYPHGLLQLQSSRGILTGSIDKGVAVGAVNLWRHSLMAFQAPVVHAPAGLYRATATVRSARLVGGWIVLPGGGQVGLVYNGDTEVPAPKVNPATGAVEIEGTRVPIAPADPLSPRVFDEP
jgi:hypothetical protein